MKKFKKFALAFVLLFLTVGVCGLGYQQYKENQPAKDDEIVDKDNTSTEDDKTSTEDENTSEDNTTDEEQENTSTEA